MCIPDGYPLATARPGTVLRDKTDPFTSYFPSPPPPRYFHTSLPIPHQSSPAQLHRSLSPGPKAVEPFLHLFYVQSYPQTLLIHTMCKNSCCSKKSKGIQIQQFEWEFQLETKTKGTEVNSRDFHTSG